MNTIQTTAETGSYVLQEQKAATRTGSSYKKRKLLQEQEATTGTGSYCRNRKLLTEQEATVETGSYSLHQQEGAEGTVNYYSYRKG